jgi:serralysin
VATPLSGIDSQPSPLSADSLVDALLVGSEWTSASLGYSFVGPGSTFSTSDATGYGPPADTTSQPWNPRLGFFTAGVQAQASSALSKWSDVANVPFAQVVDVGNTSGDIRFAFTDVGDAQAEAFSPGVAAGGDVWFSYIERFHSFAEGSYNYMALVHEIGHALGLKHPFDAAQNNGAVLPTTLDSQSYTIMSYSAQPGDITSDFSFRPTTPMVLDIQAIQFLYGANSSYNAGNTVYDFNDLTTYHQTLWDGGGLDTISYSGASASIIDLRQGAGSTIGNPVFIVDAFGARHGTVSNVWIAIGADVENASGGSGADRLTGNSLANHLAGGGGNDLLSGNSGNDRLDGGEGTDVAVFTGAMSDYTVTFNAVTACYTVGDPNRARDGTDVVSSVELFQFGDGLRNATQLTVSAPVSGDHAAVIAMCEALLGTAPGSTLYAAVNDRVQAIGASFFTVSLGGALSSVDSTELAARVLGNCGIHPGTLGGDNADLTYAGLLAAVTAVFDASPNDRPHMILDMTSLLESLEGDVIYGQAAAAFNNEIAADYNALSGVALVGVA